MELSGAREVYMNMISNTITTGWWRVETRFSKDGVLGFPATCHEGNPLSDRRFFALEEVPLFQEERGHIES